MLEIYESNYIENSNFSSMIAPNFICNRYDILYKDSKFLKIKYNDKIYHIPFHIEFITCKLGLWLVDIPQEVLNEAILYIFKTYKMVYKIKILSSINPYPSNDFSGKETNYWIDLPDTFENYFASLSKNERYNFNRHSKKLEAEIGTYEVVKYSKENIPIELINEYFKFKKSTLGKSYRLYPQEYLKKYCVTTAYALKIKNENIAIAFIVETDENVYLENITYNPKYSKYSVGVTLLVDIISDLIKMKKKQFFFGSSNKDDYKHRLCNCCQETYSIKVYSKSIPIKHFSHFIFDIVVTVITNIVSSKRSNVNV